MTFIKNIVNLFFPEVCVGCNNHLIAENLILCLNCRHDLPLTKFSFEPNNKVEKIFYGRVPIQNATALLYFSKKGIVQEMMHNLKYRNQQKIGTLLGNLLGEEMVLSERFYNIDFIIPVPLHQKKLKKRGYNQVTSFGQSVADQLKIPFKEDVLYKISNTKTQTNKLRLDRWINAEELFIVKQPKDLENKHILIVDDIVTTGATLEACAKAFEKINNLQISIACISYTQ